MNRVLPIKKHQSKIQSKDDRVFDAVITVLALLVIFICAYPIYYTVIASFSDPNAVVGGKVYLWPVGFTLDSYKSVVEHQQIWIGYRNTLFYTIVGTAYNMFLLLPAAYALSRPGLKGKGFLMGFFVFTMYFGGGMIPTYLLNKQLGLINNPLVMILPGALSVYNMIITRTYFAGFPESLNESAKIDGAGEVRIFLQIVLPLSGAIVSVMILYSAVAHWNSYFNAMMYLNDKDKYPLQMVMRQILLVNQAMSENVDGMTTEEMADLLRRKRLAETMKYAVIIIANVPVLVAYPFVQKYFVKGVMIGSIKG